MYLSFCRVLPFILLPEYLVYPKYCFFRTFYDTPPPLSASLSNIFILHLTSCYHSVPTLKLHSAFSGPGPSCAVAAQTIYVVSEKLSLRFIFHLPLPGKLWKIWENENIKGNKEGSKRNRPKSFRKEVWNRQKRDTEMKRRSKHQENTEKSKKEKDVKE